MHAILSVMYVVHDIHVMHMMHVMYEMHAFGMNKLQLLLFVVGEKMSSHIIIISFSILFFAHVISRDDQLF